jgi:NADPH-dependent 2,4-dienoyl-CoA reductase/sulfur reductase-like enzyme
VPTDVEIKVQTRKSCKEERDINVFLYHEVIAIYPAKQSVLVKNLQTGAKNEYQYDKLVITTGARIFVPPIKGIEIKSLSEKSIMACVKVTIGL